MKHRLTSLLVALVLITMISVVPQATFAQEAVSTDVIPGHYIVTLRDTAGIADVEASSMAKQYSLRVSHVYDVAIKGFAARIPATRLNALRNDPRVLNIEADRIVRIAAQGTPTGILRIQGNVSPTAKIDGIDERVNVNVAVIDTGIQSNHPDLNVVGGYNCVTNKRTAWADGNGHGTHVAGTIGALDNNIGVVGVAPGARLWAVRVLNNQGSGTTSSVICGINWVTSQAATIKVANMSLGGSGSDSTCGGSDSYHNAICNSVNAGVTYAVAAGNSAANAQNYRPATYAEVITVSALADFNGAPGGGAAATCRTDVDDTFASFSNYGTDVDIIAPGVCINSTWIGSSYNTISGTSMATPHVTGAAALYIATHPGATPAQVKAALLSAGNTNWTNSDDPDGIKEPLLNVSTF